MLMIPPKVSFTKVMAETSIQRISRQKLAHLLMLLPKLWDLHKVYGRNKHTKIIKTETSLPVNVAAKGELHKGRGTNKYTKIMKTETSIPVDVTAKGELHKGHGTNKYTKIMKTETSIPVDVTAKVVGSPHRSWQKQAYKDHKDGNQHTC